MFECGNLILNQTITIENSTAPLVQNITLEDQLYLRSLDYQLDEYAIFCSKIKAPVNCSTLQNPMPLKLL